MVKKLLLPLLVILFSGIVGTVLLITPNQLTIVSPIDQQISRAEEAYQERILKNPQVLEIPRIKLKTRIEHVGMNEEKEMGVPVGYDNVAWYKDGYMPGEIGNVVISGHVDTPQGSPAVFARLSEVQIDDFILVWEGTKGVMYKVYDLQTYSLKDFPMDKVFGATTDSNLSLITCTGEMVNGKYLDRYVVTAREI